MNSAVNSLICRHSWDNRMSSIRVEGLRRINLRRSSRKCKPNRVRWCWRCKNSRLNMSPFWCECPRWSNTAKMVNMEVISTIKEVLTLTIKEALTLKIKREATLTTGDSVIMTMELVVVVDMHIKRNRWIHSLTYHQTWRYSYCTNWCRGSTHNPSSRSCPWCHHCCNCMARSSTLSQQYLIRDYALYPLFVLNGEINILLEKCHVQLIKGIVGGLGIYYLMVHVTIYNFVVLPRLTQLVESALMKVILLSYCQSLIIYDFYFMMVLALLAIVVDPGDLTTPYHKPAFQELIQARPELQVNHRALCPLC